MTGGTVRAAAVAAGLLPPAPVTVLIFPPARSAALAAASFPWGHVKAPARTLDSSVRKARVP